MHCLAEKLGKAVPFELNNEFGSIVYTICFGLDKF